MISTGMENSFSAQLNYCFTIWIQYNFLGLV